MPVGQANASVSARGVLRGLHVTDVPPGQAKYVMCVSGSVFDVVVDLRVGSASFGAWTGVVLDGKDRRCVRLGDGLGHGFLSLAPDSVVVYLCSTVYSPERDRGVHPLDPRIGIDWPQVGADGAALQVLLSDKDATAPSLDDAEASGLLPQLSALRRGRGGPSSP